MCPLLKKVVEETISLPEPKLSEGISLQNAISKRRSIRAFSSKELSPQEISQLCWAANGITDKREGFRSAPSAGALYPLEIYLAKKDGLFLYLPAPHKLKKITSEDLRAELAKASYSQDFIEQAPLNLIICAVFSRITDKYGKRGIQYSYIEAGHAAQNVHLEAVSLGMGSVPVGAFDDKGVAKALSLPKEHEPVYIIPIGCVK